MSGYGSGNRVTVERHEAKRILAKVPYWNGQGTVMAKQVPGVQALWDKSGERDKFIGWTYPLDIQVCRRLREVFGERLDIGPDLHEWATAEVTRQDAQVALRSASVAELPETFRARAPLLAAAFDARPFQSAGAMFCAEGGNVILADEPGLGKTLQTLGALEIAAACRVLVFCRTTAERVVWERETARWLPEARAFVTDSDNPAAKRREVIEAFEAEAAKEERLCLLICNPEMVRTRVDHVGPKQVRVETHVYPELFAQEWHAIVVDESHRSLIGRSHLSKATPSGRQKITQVRLGMYRLPLAEGGMKLALSGTPFRGKQLNLWGTLNWLRPDVFTSYWNFAKMYFEVEDAEYGGGLVISGEEIRPEMIEAWDAMLAPYMMRRTKREVAPDMPPKIYMGTPLDPADPESPHGVWVKLGSKQRRAYKALVKNGKAELSNGTLLANGALAELTRLRQFASSNWEWGDGGNLVPCLPSSKLEWILDFLDAHRGNEGKVIIASQFTKLVNFFSREITKAGHENWVITGETSQRERTAIVRDFADPDSTLRVIVINSEAGGESITLDAADVVIIVDESAIPDVQIQVEDRADRLSRVTGTRSATRGEGNGNATGAEGEGVARPRPPVSVYYLRALGTVEQDIAVKCGARLGACERSLDGSRGVEILRQAAEA